jgi:hypothetical protein
VNVVRWLWRAAKKEREWLSLYTGAALLWIAGCTERA